MRDWVSKLRKLDFLGYQMVKTDTLAFICLDTGSVYEGPKIADLKFNIIIPLDQGLTSTAILNLCRYPTSLECIETVAVFLPLSLHSIAARYYA